MPGYKIHLFGGLFFYLILLALTFSLGFLNIFSSLDLLSCAMFIFLGSIFPDIDIVSKGQRFYYYALLIFIIYGIAIKRIDLYLIGLILGVLPLVTKHHGLVHNPWFNIVVSISLIFYLRQFDQTHAISFWSGLFFLFGVFSHLILDFGLKGFIKRFYLN